MENLFLIAKYKFVMIFAKYASMNVNKNLLKLGVNITSASVVFKNY